MRHCHGNLLK